MKPLCIAFVTACTVAAFLLGESFVRDHSCRLHTPVLVLLHALLVALLLNACASMPPLVATPAPELILLDWEDDIFPELLAGFTQETGVRVTLNTYTSSAEARQRLLAGEAADLAVLDNENLPALIAAERLLPLEPSRLPNFRHISPGFRDLVVDPENRYSVPFTWGTTGLVYRRGQVDPPPQRWADLWDEANAGQVFLWDARRTVIGATLKALGYSANSEDPAALEAAAAYLRRLRALPPQPYHPPALAEAFRSGQARVALAWVGDYLLARQSLPDLEYVLPAEGSVLWMDHYVIPRSARYPEWAHRLLDYLLRPEVSARLSQEGGWASANEAAWPLLQADEATRALIYPPAEALRGAELLMPLDAQTEAMYNQIWEQFLNTFSPATDMP